LKENNYSTLKNNKIENNKNNKKVLFLAPFDGSSNFKIKKNIELYENQISINILLTKNKIGSTVAKQKFWLGYFSKECNITTN